MFASLTIAFDNMECSFKPTSLFRVTYCCYKNQVVFDSFATLFRKILGELGTTSLFLNHESLRKWNLLVRKNDFHIWPVLMISKDRLLSLIPNCILSLDLFACYLTVTEMCEDKKAFRFLLMPTSPEGSSQRHP